MHVKWYVPLPTMGVRSMDVLAGCDSPESDVLALADPPESTVLVLAISDKYTKRMYQFKLHSLTSTFKTNHYNQIHNHCDNYSLAMFHEGEKVVQRHQHHAFQQHF